MCGNILYEGTAFKDDAKAGTRDFYASGNNSRTIIFPSFVGMITASIIKDIFIGIFLNYHISLLQ